MTAKKADRTEPAAVARGPSPGGFRFWRWGLVVVALAAAGVGLWMTVWDQVRDRVLARPEYRIDSSAIELTPPPPWIHADIKGEVIRSGSLDHALSLVDDAVTVRIAQAFSLHPWVAKVTRVSKSYPARVEVEAVYRRPAAMVAVSGGLLPVDGDGVLLPSDDFSPAEAERYPRLMDIKTVPLGPQGSRWGDARVTGGARLAAVLGDDWQRFHLKMIVPVVPAAGIRSGDDILYELVTERGTRVTWWHAPGSERPCDARANEKLALLRQIFQRDGALEGPDGRPRTLDVRSGRDFSTARRPTDPAGAPTDEASR